MATRKWFVLADEGEMGPLGPNGLRKLVADGTIDAATLLRREDRDEPIRADRITGLIPADDLPELEEWHEPTAPRGRQRHRWKPLHRHGTYRPLASFAIAATCCLGASALLGVLQAFNRQAITAALSGPGDGDGLTAALQMRDTLETVHGVVFLTAIVATLLWLWFARANVTALMACQPSFSPGWAMAGWFVPFVNLFRPYQVVSEVYDLSAAAAAHVRRLHPRHWLLGAWWALFLIPVVVIPISWGLVEDQLTANRVAAGLLLAWALSSALFVVILWKVTLRQQASAADLAADGELDLPGAAAEAAVRERPA